MTETAISKTGCPIRLTDERWVHITEEHAELAGHRRDVLEAIAEPERILAGNEGELLARVHSRMVGFWSLCIVSSQRTDS